MKKQITKNQYHCKCERCGYEWVSRKGVPMVCPNKRCHNPRWDQKAA
ncbi:MAG TPA: hypothetical protein VL866_24580 [Pyrinomonadaceae bacterium]|nr:hypothetical protein [Pyrinomonadaceae bacterium]